MLKRFAVFLMYCIHPLIVSGESMVSFEETIRGAPMLQQQALQTVQTTDIKTIVNESVPASEDPNQLNALMNEWNTDGTHLKEKAVTASQENEVGRVVVESKSSTEAFKVNVQDPEIRHLRYISNHADEFLEGHQDENGTCESMNICRTEYKTQLCEATHQETRVCTSHPRVTVKTHSVFKMVQFSGNLIKQSAKAWKISAQTTGRIKSVLIHLSGSENPFWCKTTYQGFLEGQLLGNFRVPCGGGMAELIFKNTNLDLPIQKGKSLLFTFDQGVIDRSVDRAVYEIGVEVEEIVAEPIITWEEQCISPIVSYCKKQEELCVKPGEIRRISVPGTDRVLDVPLDCLEKRSTYRCGLGADGCRDEEERTQASSEPCTLSSQTCLTSEEGFCLREERSYLCSHQLCDNVSKICGSKIFCLEGDCLAKQDAAFDSNELKKDLTDLAALSEATQGVGSDGAVNIFGGEALSCGGDGIGYSKCCEDRGWGHDLGFSRCSEDEKRLGLAREKGWAIALGTQCVADTPFGCLREKQVFCVFQNKLSRIVQEHGRLQVGLSFGSAESPDCRGLSMSEIESIRFDLMPLESAFDDEIAPGMQLKSADEIHSRIKAKLPSFQKREHFDGQ